MKRTPQLEPIDFSRESLLERIKTAAEQVGNPLRYLYHYEDAYGPITEHMHLGTILEALLKGFNNQKYVKETILGILDRIYEKEFLRNLLRDLPIEARREFPYQLCKNFDNPKVHSALNSCQTLDDRVKTTVVETLYHAAHYLGSSQDVAKTADTISEFRKNKNFSSVLQILRNIFTSYEQAEINDASIKASFILRHFKDNDEFERISSLLANLVESYSGSVRRATTYDVYTHLETLLIKGEVEHTLPRYLKLLGKIDQSMGLQGHGKSENFREIVSSISRIIKERKLPEKVLENIENLLDIKCTASEKYENLKKAMSLMEKIEDKYPGKRLLFTFTDRLAKFDNYKQIRYMNAIYLVIDNPQFPNLLSEIADIETGCYYSSSPHTAIGANKDNPRKQANVIRTLGKVARNNGAVDDRAEQYIERKDSPWIWRLKSPIYAVRNALHK